MTEKDPQVYGEVFNEDQQRKVEQVAYYQKHIFKVKTPDGKEFEVEGKLANA